MESRDALLNFEEIDLRLLVNHRHAIAIDRPLDEVFQQFSEHNYEFMAVLDQDTCIGLCSRRQIGMLLGTHYGRALYATKPIGRHLLPQGTRVLLGTPFSQVLQQASDRPKEHIYDDLLLVDENGRFEGLILFSTLVQLQTQYLLQNIQQLEEQQTLIRQKNRQMESELVLASELQSSILPQDQGNQHLGDNGYQLFHRYRAASLVGGDFFFTLEMEDGSIGILVCDVMGHGVRSALVTAMLRALVETHRLTAPEPGEFLRVLNQELFAMLQGSDDGLFVTALFLYLDNPTQQVRYAKAGHHDPLVIRYPERSLTQMTGQADDTGPPLGLFPTAFYGSQIWPGLPTPGTCFLLFTDGLFEVFNTKGMPYGEDRLASLIQELLPEPPPILFDRILQELADYASTDQFSDDICLVGLLIDRPQHS